MRRTEPVALRSAILSAFLFCVTTAPPGAAADPASPAGQKDAAARLPAGEDASAAPPKALARFPGAPYAILHNFDGSAVCCTTEGVFLASGDLHKWSAVPSLPREGRNIQPVGGDRTRFFVVDMESGMRRQMAENATSHEAIVAGEGNSLEAATIGGKIAVVREGMAAGVLCSFASRDVGAIAWNGAGGSGPNNNNLLVTVDGGATWKPTPPAVVGEKLGPLRRLKWVSTSQLLAAGGGGTMELYEHKGDGVLRRLWTAAAPAAGAYCDLALDGDFVWIGDQTLGRIRLADGRLDAKIEASDPVDRAAACHDRLLLWGQEYVPAPTFLGPSAQPSGRAEAAMGEGVAPPRAVRHYLCVWARGRNSGYVRRKRIETPKLAGVLPLKSPLCLLIAEDGRGLRLDLDGGTLTPAALQVTPLPPAVPAPRFADAAAKAEWEEIKAKRHEAFELAKRVPEADRNVIYNAVVATPNLTGRQQADLFAQKFREYIQVYKPGPVVDSPPASDAEYQALNGLVAKTPARARDAIEAEARKTIGLSERGYVLLLTQKYREYLATHKPGPDVNRMDATPDERGAMYELSGKVPDADRNAIFAECDKKTNMTDLEKTRWTTEQFRKYIDEHKAKHDKETKKDPKE